MFGPFLAASSLASDPSGAVVAFLGSVLVATSAAVFGFYALRNLQLNRLESQGPFWRYLALVGTTAALYGVFGVLGVVVDSRVLTAFGHGALLFCIVFLAFSMREVYYNSALAPPADEGIPLSTLRRIEVAFVVVIVVEWLGVLLIDQLVVAQLVKAGGSLAFATYGVLFAEKLESMTSGTSLDTLRRHLLPVLVSLGVLGLADLGVVVGLQPLVVNAIKSVFVVLVGGFFVTATIRLQQNVEGLSAP
ncbi:hypothetical protein [Halorussus halophilus]|uniref:hypothetical protein n=1 Tax=Halorussus halophilus TaxID=2650975 RepID=UPI00130136F5|nr:hypothetical protein [Halorussus halophilus]